MFFTHSHLEPNSNFYTQPFRTYIHDELYVILYPSEYSPFLLMSLADREGEAAVCEGAE